VAARRRASSEAPSGGVRRGASRIEAAGVGRSLRGEEEPAWGAGGVGRRSRCGEVRESEGLRFERERTKGAQGERTNGRDRSDSGPKISNAPARPHFLREREFAPRFSSSAADAWDRMKAG
jgi:hypothetical protein